MYLHLISTLKQGRLDPIKTGRQLQLELILQGKKFWLMLMFLSDIKPFPKRLGIKEMLPLWLTEIRLWKKLKDKNSFLKTCRCIKLSKNFKMNRWMSSYEESSYCLWLKAKILLSELYIDLVWNIYRKF